MRLFVTLVVALPLVACGQPQGTPTAARQAAAITAPIARSDKEQVLDAIVRDVLESDFLKQVRADYGTPGDKRLALVSNAKDGVPWPANYRPVVPERYEIQRVAEGASGAEDQPRMLGIRIDKLNLGQKETALFRESIEVTVMNAGGDQERGHHRRLLRLLHPGSEGGRLEGRVNAASRTVSVAPCAKATSRIMHRT